jgi:predicted Zn finger-like uncharacterized protein
MIISCPVCPKKFEVDSSLIPNKGRYLLCGSCDHKWFYKKDLTKEKNITETVSKKEINKIKPKKEKIKKTEVSKFESSHKAKKNNKIGILSGILIFLISFIALIVIIDTFENIIKVIFPNIDVIMNSLYETLQDIILFIKDLF